MQAINRGLTEAFISTGIHCRVFSVEAFIVEAISRGIHCRCHLQMPVYSLFKQLTVYSNSLQFVQKVYSLLRVYTAPAADDIHMVTPLRMPCALYSNHLRWIARARHAEALK